MAGDPLPLPPTPSAENVPHAYIVNSSPEFLDMMREVLADDAITVTVEELRPNVEVTLNNLRAARPDVLLLDVVPFRGDAGRLLGALAESDDLQELPVLLTSTSTRAAERLANDHAALVRDVLPKPFELDELYAKLRMVIGAAVPGSS